MVNVAMMAVLGVLVVVYVFNIQALPLHRASLLSIELGAGNPKRAIDETAAVSVRIAPRCSERSIDLGDRSYFGKLGQFGFALFIFGLRSGDVRFPLFVNGLVFGDRRQLLLLFGLVFLFDGLGFGDFFLGAGGDA